MHDEVEILMRRYPFLQTTLREPVEMRNPVPVSSGTVRIGAASLGWRLASVAGDGRMALGPPAASGGGSAEAER
jgi:hypothetical protein